MVTTLATMVDYLATYTDHVFSLHDIYADATLIDRYAYVRI